MRNRKYIYIICLVVVAMIVIAVWGLQGNNPSSDKMISIDNLPSFSGEPYVIVNNNEPQFTKNEITNKSFEYYSDLDALNRCGYAFACIGRDIMPDDERSSIGQVKPTGWQTIKYDFVDGKYLYNRCHLIGYQLTGENANIRNLITGTRFLNVEGMLPFENMVADYVKETGNHVMYRVTPVFANNELVARGIQMEALSVEDDGYGISFNVYVYNNQPGVVIDYATGESSISNEDQDFTATTVMKDRGYILNINSKKFHLDSCGQGQGMKEDNKQYFEGGRDELIADGYTPAGCCDP